MNYSVFLQKLKDFIPDNSFEYYKEILDKNEFAFLIKNPRQRKLGDFKVDFNTGLLTITINNNLNPYQFHLTFLHEYAHYLTYKKYSNKVKPHGVEWKIEFQKLLINSIENNIFNGEIKDIIIRCYLVKKLSFNSNCREFDSYIKSLDQTYWISLNDIPDNTYFISKSSNRIFKKLNTRRTRCLCEEYNTNQRYLIHKDSEIYNFVIIGLKV